MGSVKGINETIRDLRKFGKDAIISINSETEQAALDIEDKAKKLAPVNFGKLQQSISVKKESQSVYSVNVNERYGAYIEFGTGRKVKVPSEWKEMAMSFKSGGQGGVPMRGMSFQDGLDSITEWCKAKGIPIIQAKWIFLKILGAGINPQPFLYPAYIQGKKKYLDNLTKLLKSFNKKI